MLIAITSFPNEGRKLRHFITGLLKSGTVASVQRINYIKSFSLQEGKIKKEEKKLLLIKLPKENKQALTAFIKKNHPHQVPDLVFLHAEDVDAAYLERVRSFAKKSGKK